MMDLSGGIMILVQMLPWFFLSVILEMGGGYLVWRWLRKHQSPWQGVLGMLMLAVAVDILFGGV